MKEHTKKCATNHEIIVVNGVIKPKVCDCDSYHTFKELYEHRSTLFIVLCKQINKLSYIQQVYGDIWRSKLHSDGTSFDNFFIFGIGKEKDKQITYHLPLSKWEETDFAETLNKAPEFDGHTNDDILKRLKSL